MKETSYKIYRFMASIKLAVVELLALAVILALATFYESKYDTKTAQHLVYGSWWFALFLAVLWVNVFCATLIRYPWKSYQTGFVITHLGLLVLLAGSLATFMFGVEGQMAVREGEKSDRLTLDPPVLLYGDEETAMQEVEAEFRWNQPTPEHPYRVPLSRGITAVVDGYIHNSVVTTRYLPDPKGPPAVKLRFDSSRFSNLSQWLTPNQGAVNLGPATVKLAASTPQELDLLRESAPPSSDQRGEVQFLVNDLPFRLEVSRLQQQALPLGDTGYRARVLRYLPDAGVVDDELVSKSDTPRNPCVELELTSPQGSLERYYLFAALPQLNTKFKQTGPPFPIRVLYSYAPEGADRAHELNLYATPDGRLYARVDQGSLEEMQPGKPLKTGWMDIQVTAEQFFPGAVSETLYEPAALPEGEKEGPPPAIRVTLEGSKHAQPFWLQRGDVREARGADDQPFLFGYSLKTVGVGFELELLDFTVDYDPGTRNPAAYKSNVRVEGTDQVIQMNEPLYKNGYTFFQSSFQEVPDGPAISVFSVARDPGIFWKYLGSILLVGGIFTMFYLKPYMQGKRDYKRSLKAPPGPSRPRDEETPATEPAADSPEED